MKKEAYDKFMKKISSEFKNVDTVKEFLLDAAELAMYGEKRVALEKLKKATDDLLLDDDGEGYTSKKLGLRIYCPDDIVEQVIIHDVDYYKS